MCLFFNPDIKIHWKYVNTTNDFPTLICIFFFFLDENYWYWPKFNRNRWLFYQLLNLSPCNARWNGYTETYITHKSWLYINFCNNIVGICMCKVQPFLKSPHVVCNDRHNKRGPWKRLHYTSTRTCQTMFLTTPLHHTFILAIIHISDKLKMYIGTFI